MDKGLENLPLLDLDNIPQLEGNNSIEFAVSADQRLGVLKKLRSLGWTWNGGLDLLMPVKDCDYDALALYQDKKVKYCYKLKSAILTHELANTNKGGTMKENLKKNLNELLNSGKAGMKTAGAAGLTDKILEMFHRHVKVPKAVEAIPFARDIEGLLIPGALYLLSTLHSGPTSKQAGKICLVAFQGKSHDLSKLLLERVEPLLRDIASLSSMTGSEPQDCLDELEDSVVPSQLTEDDQ